MSNVLKAFLNIVKSYQQNIDNFNSGSNRANNMGEGLENYIKDAFASTLE
ncbi:MAG: NgoPII family restriction endonuclease, partial [Campylobacterales bacterium]